MKNLKLLILLNCTCWSTLGITAQTKSDSVTIHKSQIKNIYVGLKQSEYYKKYYNDCLQGSIDLQKIIKDQDQELQKSIQKIILLNSENEILNNKINYSEVEIQRLKNKKIPIWKHPILYAAIGFIGGVYLMK